MVSFACRHDLRSCQRVCVSLKVQACSWDCTTLDTCSTVKFGCTCSETYAWSERIDGCLRPPLFIYLLHMCRKQPLYTYRFKIWPPNWVHQVRSSQISNWISHFSSWAKFSINFGQFSHETVICLLLVENLTPDCRSCAWFPIGCGMLAITQCLVQFLIVYGACMKTATFFNKPSNF